MYSIEAVIDEYNCALYKVNNCDLHAIKKICKLEKLIHQMNEDPTILYDNNTTIKIKSLIHFFHK